MMRLLQDDQAKDVRYRNLFSGSIWSENARQYIENLIAISIDLLDKKFISQIKDNVSSGFAEIYFASTCRDRLKLGILHPSDKGPDFFLNELNCWIECVSPTAGIVSNLNSVPDPVFNEARCFPKEQFLLRMLQAFTEKSKKMDSDIEKGIVQKDQPIVLFISGGGIQDSELVYPFPPIFDVLLGLGQLILSLNERKVEDYSFTARTHISRKSSDIEIAGGCFGNSKHAHISAVIYSYANFANPLAVLGQDFITLHNPFAKNKLPLGFISCGKECVFDGGKLLYINTFDPDIF